ncbi:uncharacterized protein LOC112568583 [Pomacea canaliculata]|uniref:uncharacterized protein LOC112568583 n=1 Tax=Pomacea canaliculata TaxID=400727 RepID=UPI000D72FF72|nr:uncharacterized protein LOC112568583 [Pomacea canaliculata]
MARGLVTAVGIFLITCHKIFAISISTNNEVEELSLNQRSVSCNQLTPNSTIYWSISPLHGQVKQVGMCGVGICTSGYRPNVYSERNIPASSSLVFLNVTRDWAGTVVCTERFANGSEQSVNSTLDVYYNSGVNNSRMVINREDWSLTVSFNITKIFSALGNYGAEVFCRRGYLSTNATVNMSLVSFNESSLMYNVGYLQVTFPRLRYSPSVIFHRCAYIIAVRPGAKYTPLPLEDLKRIFDMPTPTLSCNQAYIPEEGPASCICNSTLLRHPEARLRWVLREQSVVSGDYGVGWLPLPPEVVNRTHDGKNLVCEVEWFYNRRTELRMLVAYGPDHVTIRPYRVVYGKDTINKTLLAAYPVTSGQAYLPPDDTSEVTLVCEVKNAQPLKSEMVTWDGLCDGQKGFTCNLVFKGKTDDGMMVTCTVINDANNNHTANTSIILNVSDGPETVSIQYHTTSTPDKCHVILTCEASGVKPSTYDMFEWGGMCEGQQGSRCVITADNEKDDGREVTCTVTNHVNHGLTASASVTLTLSGCEGQDDPMSKGVGIGVGVTLTLELLVVGVVVVVIWTRRRLQRDRIYEKPSPNPRLSHTYEMARAGHDPSTPESQEQIAVTPSPPCEVYENVSS